MTVQTPKAASQAPGAHSEPSSSQAQSMPPQSVAGSHPPAFQPAMHVCHLIPGSQEGQQFLFLHMWYRQPQTVTGSQFLCSIL